MSVNQRIEDVRKYLNVSQREFSNAIDIDEATYSKIKKGVLNPGKTILEKIVKLCNNISISWLFFGEGNMLIEHENIQHVAEPTENYTAMENESWKNYIMDDLRRMKHQIEQLTEKVETIENQSKKKRTA